MNVHNKWNPMRLPTGSIVDCDTNYVPFCVLLVQIQRLYNHSRKSLRNVMGLVIHILCVLSQRPSLCSHLGKLMWRQLQPIIPTTLA